MIIRSLLPKEQRAFNQVVSHPVQTWEWGEFRRAMGVAVERIGVFQDSKLIEGIQVTFHAVPILEGRTLGNFSRGSVPNEHQLAALEQLGAMHNALAIKIEPNTSVPVDQSHRVHQSSQDFLLNHGCKPGKQHFAPYTYTIDLTKSEDALLEQMDPKTRYNVRLAHKKGVAIYENTSKEGMEIFIEILQETTDRQRFYAHTPEYFRTMWQILGNTGMLKIFTAVYQDRVLTAWVMFVHNKVLYYPYGASRSEGREVMPNNLLAWEMMRYGQKIGCTKLDLWGSLGPEADPKDPWYGFHRFKKGFGGSHEQFIGTYDLVRDPFGYRMFTVADRVRWQYLKIKAMLPIGR